MAKGEGEMRLTQRLFGHEAAGGVVLILATIVALVVANSPWQSWYVAALDAPLSITLGGAAAEATGS